jgi:hypothetical protein
MDDDVINGGRGVQRVMTIDDEGGEGVQNVLNFDDVIYGRTHSSAVVQFHLFCWHVPICTKLEHCGFVAFYCILCSDNEFFVL